MNPICFPVTSHCALPKRPSFLTNKRTYQVRRLHQLRLDVWELSQDTGVVFRKDTVGNTAVQSTVHSARKPCQAGELMTGISMAVMMATTASQYFTDQIGTH